MRSDYESQMHRRSAQMASRGFLYAAGGFSMNVRVTVNWQTAEGFPRITDPPLEIKLT